MKRILFSLLLAASLSAEAQTQTYETEFARPLNEVLTDIQNRFGIRLKYDIDTVGKILPYADFRIRPYSVEESLTNVLSPFDYKFVRQSGNLYKLKAYEYPRRTDADGEKMLAYLNTLYADKQAFELRADSLRKEVRQRLGIDTLLAQCVNSTPILSKIRKFDGYTVQNFALETLPGLYVCGSVYTPQSKGKHALIICPNGHFGGGRYREDQQQRMGTLARMGAVLYPAVRRAVWIRWHGAGCPGLCHVLQRGQPSGTLWAGEAEAPGGDPGVSGTDRASLQAEGVTPCE